MNSQQPSYKQTAQDLREIAGENLKMLEKSMDKIKKVYNTQLL